MGLHSQYFSLLAVVLVGHNTSRLQVCITQSIDRVISFFVPYQFSDERDSV